MLNVMDIFTLEALMIKAKALRKKGFKAGIDGMSAEAAELWIQINGNRLLKDICEGKYVPMPASGFVVAKQNGHYRQLAKLTALDSIVQQCLLDSFTQLCEMVFSNHSFAYRPGRGVGAALKQYCLLGDEYAYAAKLDPSECYDHIVHAVLRETIEKYMDLSADVVELIMRCVKMPIMIERRIENREEGLLQGAPLSPLLCNLYLHRLDQFLEERQASFLRYADDLVLFANNRDDIEQLMANASQFMIKELRLRTTKYKTMVATPTEIEFLGHRFVRDRQGLLAIEKADASEGAYYTWHKNQMRGSHRTVDVMSNGILRQKDFSLLFDGENQKTNIPMLSIDMINIYSSVVFDSGFLKRALENGVYINIFDTYGNLVGRFLPNCVLKAPLVTHEQLESYFDVKKRVALAKQFLLASIHNLRLVIRYYNKHAPEDVYALSLNSINDYASQIKKCKDYDRLLILEALIRKEYYECFDFFVKSDELVFEKRSRRPPRNEINAMLSFGNTMLYNLIAFKINKSPLDVRIGFLHSTNGFRKEALNLDMAEIFKPLVVDRVIFKLINMKSIKPVHFRREDNGAVYLTEEGKKVYLRAFYDKLDEGLTIGERYYTYNMLIDEEVRKLVRHFRNSEKYVSYRQVR